MKIGFVGLGNVGGKLSGSLLRNGYDVTVRDLNDDLVADFVARGGSSANSPKELAEKVNRKAKDIIKRLFEKGIIATLNDVLESELGIEIAKDFGYLAEIVSFEEDLQMQEEETMDLFY